MNHVKKQTSFSTKDLEAEFNFGYFYRTVEEHINTFATADGSPYSVEQIAFRVGNLLRAKAQEVRQALRLTELVSKVRETPTKTSDAQSEKNMDVGPRSSRALSASARKHISIAQKKRWRKWKQEQKHFKRRSSSAGMRAYWKNMSKEDRKIEMQRRMAKRKAA